MRHGRLNVATWVIVNGRSASGGFAPALTCASAGAAMSVSSSSELESFFIP